MKKYGIIAGVILLVFIIVVINMNKPSVVTPTGNTPAPTVATVVAEPNIIRISKYEYVPGTLTVKKGTTITWKNEDIAKHTVTVDEGIQSGPKSEFFGKGEVYSYTFNEVGSFPYHCEPHPYMKGMVIVVE